MGSSTKQKRYPKGKSWRRERQEVGEIRAERRNKQKRPYRTRFDDPMLEGLSNHERHLYRRELRQRKV